MIFARLLLANDPVNGLGLQSVCQSNIFHCFDDAMMISLVENSSIRWLSQPKNDVKSNQAWYFHW